VVASLRSVQDGARNTPLGQAVQEIPLVASGEAGADVSVQRSVASALDSLTGHHIHAGCTSGHAPIPDNNTENAFTKLLVYI
jgi:hypothetical protein